MNLWASRVLALASGAVLAYATSIPAAVAQSRVQVLQPDDAKAYSSALDAIAKQDWDGARAALAQAQDAFLVGPIWARLLLAPHGPTHQGEAADWLRRYGDQPLAQAVADLPAARAGGVGNLATRPPRRAFPGTPLAVRGDSASARNGIERIVQRFAANDWHGAEIAAREALEGPRAGQGQFWLGLLALRAGDYAQGAEWLSLAAEWPYHDAWGKSAAQFWAARAALATGDSASAIGHLREAARFPNTLYGQLAEAQLGRASALDFSVPALDARSLAQWVASHPGAKRAAGLAELGQLGDAELELEQLHGTLTPSQDPMFLAFSEALLAPRAQLRAAEYDFERAGAGFCPVTSFASKDDTALDRAAVLAIMRQESRFTPIAVSRSNARGLMQLLPSTAEDLKPGANFRRNPKDLHDPGLNVDLGRAYLLWLLERPAVDGDFLLALAAYNGGPGWLADWLSDFSARNDPLLVLEALPRPETRDYAERVFAYFLICRARYDEAAPERDALASGRKAIYARRSRNAR